MTTPTNNQNEQLMKFLQATPEQQKHIERILDGNGPDQPPPPTGPLLLGMSAAAKLAGVSRATIWRMCKARRLTKVEILPGSYRIRRAEIESIAAGKGVGQ